MFRALFARLTGEPARGAAMFDAAVAEARRPMWFERGRVPDTVEGRFAVLATITGLIVVRLENEGATHESVALTERFVETLDTEVREMGVGDPAVGKQVRRLVGALAARVERWRALVAGDGDWSDEVRHSLYRDEDVEPDALDFAEAELRALWRRLERTGVAALAEGRIA
jgi:cytochrome b pre-mRNA-processing protein 3